MASTSAFDTSVAVPRGVCCATNGRDDTNARARMVEVTLRMVYLPSGRPYFPVTANRHCSRSIQPRGARIGRIIQLRSHHDENIQVESMRVCDCSGCSGADAESAAAGPSRSHCQGSDTYTAVDTVAQYGHAA